MSSERTAAAILGVALLVVAGTCGCSGRDAHVQGIGAEGEFLRGQEAHERGDQLRAIEILEAFERNHPGSQFIDDALFYLGRAHQANDEQILARQAYERLLDAFPRSSYAEQSLFEIAQCWVLSMRGPALDPEPAEEALRAGEIYLYRYPQGRFRDEALAAMERVRATLAEKAYMNGCTYMRLGRPEAARQYFQQSLERDPEAPVSARALGGIAESYEKQELWAEARGAWEAALAHLGDEPARYKDGVGVARTARRRLESLPN